MREDWSRKKKKNTIKKLERTEQNYLKFEETEGNICANIVYILSVLGNGIKDL